MRSLLTLVFVCGALASSERALAQSSDHAFGLGVQFGDPSGFTAKYWFDSENALQATLGGHGDWGGAYPVVTVDWTNQVYKFGPGNEKVRFGIHFGAGGGFGYAGRSCYRDFPSGRLRCYDQSGSLFVRLPVGFAAYFPKPRIEAFAEIVPALRLAPFFSFITMGNVGGRFYF